MPLEEISPNIQTDASQNGTKQDETAPAASTASIRSSAVQSMLRNTTELGDCGQFAFRPSRIARSGSRQRSSKGRTGSSDASLNPQPKHQQQPQPQPRSHRHRGHHAPRPVPSSSALSGQETVQSTQPPLHSEVRSKRAGPHHGSKPVAANGVPTHALHSHRSLMTLRNHRDLHSGSPSVVPGQGRRPGHRASSPALSEAYPYRRGARHGYSRGGSVGTVASSPAPVHQLRPGPPGYPPELNNSVSSFARRPSPAVSSRMGLAGHAYPHQRTTTPMSHSLQSFRPVWNHSAASSRGLPKSPTESTAPRYYDYSEPFGEEDSFSPPGEPVTENLPFNMDQTVLENLPVPERRQAQSPFGTVPGSTFHPSELPTTHNRRPSEQSKQSKYSYAGTIPPRKSSLGATTVPLMRPASSKKMQVSERLPPADQDHLDGRSKDEKDNPRVSTASRRTCGSTRSSAFFPNASRSPRDLTTLAARVHSPVFDHKPSISGLMEYGNQQCDGTHQQAFSDIQRTRSQWELPSFNFRPLSFGSYSPELKERPKTSGDIRSKDCPEILSPMPERPMSSQSRKRFSRILEFPDNYVTDRGKAPHHIQTFSRLDAVEEHPDLQSLERALSPQPPGGSKVDVAEQQNHWGAVAYEPALSNANGDGSQNTIHERSTIESLLDNHIECLGLNDSGTGGEDGLFQTDSPSEHSVAALDSSGESTIRAPSAMPRMLSPLNLRPTTSSSTIRHSSLASSERRRLIPRRLFASMDARLPPGAILENEQLNSTSLFSSDSSRNQVHSSGWQTLQSTSGLLTSESTKSNGSDAKCSLTSGDMADIDSDPPRTRFKVRRLSELSLSPEIVSSLATKGVTHAPHRRSKSDMLARQASHQRRRARILMKNKRKSQSSGQLAVLERTEQLLEDPGQNEEWTTEDSPEEISETSPVAGYAELSADSVVAQPPMTLSEASVLVSTSMPRRWTSMLAAMPEPVKKGFQVVRKASVRTVHSHRSNTSIIEPLNSTRYGSQIPRLGSVPQLAPPELGPPLTSSELNLSLRFPDQPQTLCRPPLREVESFFSDDSTAAFAQKQPTIRKKFNLHSIRSGFTKSSGLLGTRHSSTLPETGTLRVSQSCRVKTEQSFEEPHLDLGDTVPMSNFAYRRWKIVGRIKGCFKRDCFQKTWALVRKGSGRKM